MQPQCLAVDALRAGPGTEGLALLLAHGYPAATQAVSAPSGEAWPLVHWLLVVWGEVVRDGAGAGPSGAALQVRNSNILWTSLLHKRVHFPLNVIGAALQARFRDGLALLAAHGVDLQEVREVSSRPEALQPDPEAFVGRGLVLLLLFFWPPPRLLY